ncbi:MAG: OmpA family protein [Bacteroidetes bacterium]|nr:OmpA family protein [Bacteroidota bacterium]
MKSSKLSILTCLALVLNHAYSNNNPGGSVKTTLSTRANVTNCEIVNTKHLEFSPAFYQNGIVFVTSQNEDSKKDRKIDERFFDLYYADLNPNGMPSEPWFFSPNLNSKLHEGPVSFGPDYQTIYFTRNEMKNGKAVTGNNGEVNLQIYMADKSPTDWINLRSLPFNGDDYNCAHPTLTADGNHLYFSSNMPGGYGGMDLYRSDKVNGQWGWPVNLGSAINTPGNEVFPYIHNSGTLFFSSDGHGGFGGLDLFMTNTPDKATEITNIGAPFNSEEDDLGFLLDNEGKTGYFASGRSEGEGKDDIYYFNLPNSLVPSADFNLAVVVSDAISGINIPSASVYVFDGTNEGYMENSELYDLELAPSGENGEMKMTLVRKPDDQLGEPTAYTHTDGQVLLNLQTNHNYVLYVIKPGYASKEVKYSTINHKENYDRLEIKLQPQNCVPMNGLVLNGKTGQGVPSAVITIENDCGETVEYVYTNLEGQFNFCLPKNCNYTLTSTKEGFEKGMAAVTTRDNSAALSPTIIMNPMNDMANQPVSKGAVIVLDKIYYDFDQSYIRKGAARDLDALVVLMKRYPSMKVEMVAHTDSRGTDEYNMALSQRRAKSAYNYVVNRGMDPSRINATGVGEQYPRNNCKDGVACNETEYQYNRRTEIRIVDIDEPVSFSYMDNKPEVIDRKD